VRFVNNQGKSKDELNLRLCMKEKSFLLRKYVVR